VSKPSASKGRRGPSALLFSNLIREERSLSVMFSLANLRLWSSMSVAANFQDGYCAHPSMG